MADSSKTTWSHVTTRESTEDGGYLYAIREMYVTGDGDIIGVTRNPVAVDATDDRDYVLMVLAITDSGVYDMDREEWIK